MLYYWGAHILSCQFSLMCCLDLDVIVLSLFDLLTRGCRQQTVQEKSAFKEELVHRPGNLLEQHRSKLEGSKRLGLSSRNSDSEEAMVRKEIEEL